MLPEMIAASDISAKKRAPLLRRLGLLHWHFVALLAVIVFFGAIRWRLLDIPLERDEGEYAYAGQLILQGIPPYQLAYNMKLPGTYAAYAGIFAIFDESSRGIHLGLLVVNSLSIILLYMIAARLFGTLAGTAAGASYALLSTHQSVLGLAAHATHFVVFTALIGLLLLLSAAETKCLARFFCSGLAFGFAFLMKQPGILFGAFAFFYLAIARWPRRKSEWMPWSKTLTALALGISLPFALTCAVMYRAGIFGNFWFWTFTYAHRYAAIQSWHDGLIPLHRNVSYLLHFTYWLWILALVGLFAPLWNPPARRTAVFVYGLLVFSCAAVCPGFYFRQHYFILLLPVTALLVGIAVASATNAIHAKSWSRWLAFVPLVVFVLACVLTVETNSEYYFTLTPTQAHRVCYAQHPFLEALPIADYLRQHTLLSDRIMVFGSEPEIYFYAHRRSASGYIYFYGLMEDQPLWPVMQKQMMSEVEANHPAYVVFVGNPYSWLLRDGSPQVNALIPWMHQYLATSFERVGVVEQGKTESHYLWDEAAKTAQPSGLTISVFKRKG